MQDDLLVAGLDLETGREVHLREPDLAYWHARGYSGRRTLVCALCHAGIDAEPGTRVPLSAAAGKADYAARTSPTRQDRPQWADTTRSQSGTCPPRPCSLTGPDASPTSSM